MKVLCAAHNTFTLLVIHNTSVSLRIDYVSGIEKIFMHLSYSVAELQKRGRHVRDVPLSECCGVPKSAPEFEWLGRWVARFSRLCSSNKKKKRKIVI